MDADKPSIAFFDDIGSQLDSMRYVVLSKIWSREHPHLPAKRTIFAFSGFEQFEFALFYFIFFTIGE